MPKVVARIVHESAEELERFEAVYRGRPEEARARFLRVLRTQPELTFDDAATSVGIPRRTAYRWWSVYQERQITGLLNMTMGRPSSLRKPPKQVQLGDGVEPLSTGALLELMNGMPLELGLLEGINGVRTRLMVLLEDVDRISISVNTSCDLERPERYRPNLSISQRADHADRLDEGMQVQTLKNPESPGQELLEQMRTGGFPFDRYHPPIAREITYGGTAEVGTIVLWREIEKRPISERTITILEHLRPFLVYVFSNLVTRHHYANPRDRVFYSALREMAQRARLTAQEQRIISYRLMGYSYKKIAAELGRTEGAVKKQLASVHRKTGTQGHSELFAKYFTPRLLREE
jgi:DNA-binding CsgD family transcriptional regulator